MAGAATLLAVLVATMLVSLAGLCLVGMLTGRLNTAGLLQDKRVGGISGARVQLLIATIFSSATFLFMTVAQPPGAGFPDLPDDLLLLAGGSNAFYLGAKIFSHTRSGPR